MESDEVPSRDVRNEDDEASRSDMTNNICERVDRLSASFDFHSKFMEMCKKYIIEVLDNDNESDEEREKETGSKSGSSEYISIYCRESNEESIYQRESNEESIYQRESKEEYVNQRESNEEYVNQRESKEESIYQRESNEEYVNQRESNEEYVNQRESNEEYINQRESKEEVANSSTRGISKYLTIYRRESNEEAENSSNHRERTDYLISQENPPPEGTRKNGNLPIKDQNPKQDESSEKPARYSFVVSFLDDVCVFNFHTLHFLEIGKLAIAKKYNKKALSLMPDNFNALWNKVRLMISSWNDTTESDIYAEAEKILERLESVIARDGKLMFIAKAEIAGMYSCIDGRQDMLLSSVLLYEQVLDDILNFPRETFSEPMMKKLVLSWKQRLVQVYAWLTYAQRHDEAPKRATEIVSEIDSNPSIDDKQKAKVWLNLAVILDHYTPRYERTYKHNFSDLPSSGHCFKNAMRLDPSNPRIYLQAGRDQRRSSRTESGLKEAIEWLKIALDGEGMEDVRDYILHHLGLAYKSLWILTVNPSYDRTVQDAYLWRRPSEREEPVPWTVGNLVIRPPNSPLPHDHIPPPYKKLPRGVDWRFFNPTARDPENKYLLEAKRCLQEAIDIGTEKCLYLIDIARLHLSAGDTTAARECFLEAEKQPFSEMVRVSAVGASLYESIAFFEETKMIRNGFDWTLAEKIKSLYRESIRMSTHNKWTPVVAFHYLLRILYKQLENSDDLETETDRMILQDEYFLLYMAIQEAGDSRDILKSLTTDDFKLQLMWRLIEMFFRGNEMFDAEAGFTYFSILAVSGKMKGEVNGVNLTSNEKQRMLLGLAERVAAIRTNQVRYLREEYRELYDLRTSTVDPELAQESLSVPLTDLEMQKLDVVRRIIFPGLKTSCVRATERC